MGINQVQIREQVGLNFAAALRSFLRQDPNIILVERSATTRRRRSRSRPPSPDIFVLSTLHTNDAPSTHLAPRHMGIEPFLVGTAVNLIQAQRLIRRICAQCKFEMTDVPSKALIDIGFTPDQVGGRSSSTRAKACGTCNGTGYKGRVGLYEVMEISEGIREPDHGRRHRGRDQAEGARRGMLTLRMSGLEKIKLGITTLEEVLRETVF